jgi:SAM-dependent methyltransferase
MNDLDSIERESYIRKTIWRKKALYLYYCYIYKLYYQIAQMTPQGKWIEIGSGGGFIKDLYPQFTTTDYLPYQAIDQQLDVTKMNCPDQDFSFIGMHNVLHHVPSAVTMFKEISRTLKKGGKLVILDQNLGVFSRPILKYFHHEPCDENAKEWNFSSTGPLSSANGALAWIIFIRDRDIFTQTFPELQIDSIRSFAPLSYWLSGGLKWWNLIPGFLFNTFFTLENALAKKFFSLGSMLEIVITKKS